MNQQKLSFNPAPAAFESDTSNEAAAKVTGKRGMILHFLHEWPGGATDEELVNYINSPGIWCRWSTVVSTRNSLVRDGLVRDTGRRRLSPTSGVRCAVWGEVKS